MFFFGGVGGGRGICFFFPRDFSFFFRAFKVQITPLEVEGAVMVRWDGKNNGSKTSPSLEKYPKYLVSRCLEPLKAEPQEM